MSRQEQVYAGPVMVDDGESYYAEVWKQGDTAVVFSRPENTVKLALHSVQMSNDPAGQLVLVGSDEHQNTHNVHTTASEQTLGNLIGATVRWGEEPHWDRASVSWSQYRVTITAPDQEPRVYAGAAVRAYPQEAFIVLPDGEEVHVSLPVRAGCCGARR